MNIYPLQTSHLMNKTHHILIIDIQNQRQTFYLEQDSYSIGRSLENSIVLDSKQVSRHHATLVRKFNPSTQEFCFWLIDGDLLGNKSHNGIFVNRQRCFVQLLQDRDTIYFTSDIKASYHCFAGKKANNDEQKATTETQSRKLDKVTLSLKNPHREELEEESISAKSYGWHPVTKLPNSVLFKDYVKKALANSKRNHNSLAVVFLEITNLDSIKDNYSINNDVILKIVAKKLQTLIRQGDVIGHWEKNQFSILFSNFRTKNIMIRLAQRMMQIFDYDWQIETHSISLKASLGISLYPEDGQDQNALFKAAKYALLLAKENGNCNYYFYDQRMNIKTSIIVKLANRLEDALKKNELFLYYQPQVNLQTRKLSALEALIR